MRVTITYMEGETVMHDKDIICGDVTILDGYVCVKNNANNIIRMYSSDSFIKMSVNR